MQLSAGDKNTLLSQMYGKIRRCEGRIFFQTASARIVLSDEDGN
jgi:hypothetical protein